MLGDQVVDTGADVIGSIKSQDSAANINTPVGASTDPTQFTRSALQTESRYINDSMAADHEEFDAPTAPFYTAYNTTTSSGRDALNSATYFSLNQNAQTQQTQQKARQVQAQATRVAQAPSLTDKIANGLDTFTRDLMGDVAGRYGTDYFDSLRDGSDLNQRLTNAAKFLGADIGLQLAGEGAGMAIDTVSMRAATHGWASFFGGSADGVAREFDAATIDNGFQQTGAGKFSGSADAAYDSIRKNKTDIAAISKNTGIKPENIAKIKNHLFYNEHLLDRYVDYGIPAESKVFDSDIGIANSWARLEAGNHTNEDLQLLRHETAEAWYMNRYRSGYTAAHNAADRKFPAPDLDNMPENKKRFQP